MFRAGPTPSLLRGFSAPVKLQIDLDEDDLLRALRHDSDPFNRWQAAQTCAMRLSSSAVDGVEGAAHAGLQAAASRRRCGAFSLRPTITPSRRRSWRCRANPTWPAKSGRTSTRCDTRCPAGAARLVGRRLGGRLREVYDSLGSTAPYSPDAASAGRRALRNAVLDLLAAGDPDDGASLAAAQFDDADNMTDRLAALAVLALIPGRAREGARRFRRALSRRSAGAGQVVRAAGCHPRSRRRWTVSRA